MEVRTSTPVQTALGAFVWHDHASRDPQKAQQFYTALFGWQTEVPGDLDYTMIVSDGKQHGGFWPPAEGDAPAQWLGHVLVSDVDATASRAEAAGGSLLFEPMDAPAGRRFAVIRDPEGAAVPAYVVGNKVGAIFLPFKEMAPFVDLVRNEKPIYAYLNRDRPEWNNLSTGPEPAGERRRRASLDAPPAGGLANRRDRR